MAPAFSKFALLPTELQEMVWERVPTPARIIRGVLNNSMIVGSRGLDPTPTPPLVIPRESTIPPILHACHMSRAIGLKKFQLYTWPEWAQRQGSPEPLGPLRHAYVDYETDIFCVGTVGGGQDHKGPLCRVRAPLIRHVIRPLVHGIETTALEPPSDPADPSTWDPVYVDSCVEKTKKGSWASLRPWSTAQLQTVFPDLATVLLPMVMDVEACRWGCYNPHELFAGGFPDNIQVAFLRAIDAHSGRPLNTEKQKPTARLVGEVMITGNDSWSGFRRTRTFTADTDTNPRRTTNTAGPREIAAYTPKHRVRLVEVSVKPLESA
ncbi:hypothetical protein B0T19DRAFT_442673 [Cercophora scortea]|uniref:2EXR domain-containing protein n=1 Tax=Cercophora scortea TaxID=314031 RepID=A0AAE0IDY0_9PEZI|nr:hypothetical protein B0T19DRAFT_442673 [Cercophora scortea]